MVPTRIHYIGRNSFLEETNESCRNARTVRCHRVTYYYQQLFCAVFKCCLFLLLSTTTPFQEYILARRRRQRSIDLAVATLQRHILM